MKKNLNHHRAYFATGEIIDVYGGKRYFARKVRLVQSFIEPGWRKVWFRETPDWFESMHQYYKKFCEEN